MPKITYIDSDGTERVIDAEAGSTVMEAAIKNGVPGIEAECGGACACATCHVYVDTQDLSETVPMSTDEDELLDSSSHRRANSRLSCQIPFKESLDGLVVAIAPEN
jgi:2Fe-2S ferredoxin